MVSRLTLLEPVAFRALELAGDEQTLGPATRFFSNYADRVTAGESEAVGEMIDFWFGPGAFSKLPPAVQAYLKGGAAKNGADVRAALSEAISVAQLQAFSGPLTVAYGIASPETAAAIARALVRLLPRAQICAIPGAAHGMIETHPKDVADLVGSPAAS